MKVLIIIFLLLFNLTAVSTSNATRDDISLDSYTETYDTIDIWFTVTVNTTDSWYYEGRETIETDYWYVDWWVYSYAIDEGHHPDWVTYITHKDYPNTNNDLWWVQWWSPVPPPGGEYSYLSTIDESTVLPVYLEGQVSWDPGYIHANLAVLPEPVSSTLFIIGGATLGLRRFRKQYKK